MCFYHDYDWVADIWNETSGVCTQRTRCDECGGVIDIGEWRCHIYQQEYEVCPECGEVNAEDAADPDEDLGPCEWHTCPGETYDYDRCLACDKLLRAIEQIEIEEGCPWDARRPALSELYEEMHNTGEGDKFASRAIKMFPELANVARIAEWVSAET